MNIIKFLDLVSVGNCIFINRCFSCKSYSVFSHLYNLATGRHNHKTRFAINGLLILPNCNTAQFSAKALSYIPQSINETEKVIKILIDFIIFYLFMYVYI